jgi:hypothetical protein
MARNGDFEHHCMQATRLRRIEQELADIEARRREDVQKTLEVMGGMASELNQALSFFTTAKKQIKLLFAKMNAVTRELERQKRPRR